MAGKLLDYSLLEDGYVDYLRNTRGFTEDRIRYLCSPIIRLITDRDYSTDRFLRDSYEIIYESLTGKPYNTKHAKNIRQAINHYKDYVTQEEKDD